MGDMQVCKGSDGAYDACDYEACSQALARARREQTMQAWAHAIGACSYWAGARQAWAYLMGYEMGQMVFGLGLSLGLGLDAQQK